MLWKHLAFGNSRIELCGYGARMRPNGKRNTQIYIRIKRGWFGSPSIKYTHTNRNINPQSTERDSETKNNGNNKNNYHEKQRLQWWWCSEYLTVNTRLIFFCAAAAAMNCPLGIFVCLYVCVLSNLNVFSAIEALSILLCHCRSLLLSIEPKPIEQLVQQFICVPW